MAKQMDEAKAEILRLAEGGWPYKKIADTLNKQGYVNKRGKPVTFGDVSTRLISWGKRKNARRRKSAKAPSILKDVEDLVTSNLEVGLKERLLKKLLE